MESYSLSIRLANGCCNPNYLKKCLSRGSVVMYGRKYHWEKGRSDLFYTLYCNHKPIGNLQIDTIRIDSKEMIYCPNESFLKALIALFNLYPL